MIRSEPREKKVRNYVLYCDQSYHLILRIKLGLSNFEDYAQLHIFKINDYKENNLFEILLCVNRANMIRSK